VDRRRAFANVMLSLPGAEGQPVQACFGRPAAVRAVRAGEAAMFETSPAIRPARSGQRWSILACLALILAYPLFSVPVQGLLQAPNPRIGTIGTRIISEAAIWLYGAIVLAVALYGERRTLASIGIGRFTLASVGFAVGGVVAMAAAGQLAAFIMYDLLHHAQHADAQASALVDGSAVYGFFLALRAGVIEEVFFRGLAIEQLAKLTGNRWLAAAIALVVFVLFHALRFDWVQLVPIAAVGAVLTGLYLWRHDLWANILAHVALDGAGLMTLAFHAHR
jgi:membrane protease YdiL (CAAX protease family)